MKSKHNSPCFINKLKSNALIFSLLMVTLLPSITFAQAPDWVWAKSAGGSKYDRGSNITTDLNGNIYVIGYFKSSSITFGSTTLTNTNTDSSDIFIVKYDPTGNVIWAKSTGGSSDEWGTSITTDGFGNVFVAGDFESSSITLGSTTLVNANPSTWQVFIAKYDTNGNVLWAKNADGNGNTRNLVTDASGNVYLAGDFYSASITFGTTTLTNVNYGFSTDIYLVKYSASGSVIWAKSTGGDDYDRQRDITIDATGNIFVVGEFTSSSITFGTTTLTNVINNYSSDLFVVKYDSNGNVIWAKSAGGNYGEYGNSISSDVNGNIFVTGYFESTSVTFGTTTLTNSGYTDVFIVKYDSNGNIIFAKSAGGNNYDGGTGISTDNIGNIYVTGYFESSSITFDGTTLTNVASGDFFVVKYDNTGNLVYAKSTGGDSYEQTNSIFSEANGNVYVTGEFYSQSIDFGTTTLTNSGHYDIFIAKLGNTNGIEETKTENKILILPNPASDYIQIQTHERSDIEIYNIQGIKVQSIKSNGQCKEHKVNVEDLPAGVYFVKVILEKGSTVSKFVKE